MNLDKRLKELDAWFASEEGKASIKSKIAEMKTEEELAAELERNSTLKYKDGQKVMRGDVFIDGYHESLASPFYGTTSYVARINKDGTIDNCFSSCIAWRANDYVFNPGNSRLIRRNGKLQSPFDGVPIIIE